MNRHSPRGIRGRPFNGRLSTHQAQPKSDMEARRMTQSGQAKPPSPLLQPNSVFIGRLPSSTTKEHVESAVREIASPAMVDVYVNQQCGYNGVRRRHAFLKYGSPAEAQDAMNKLLRSKLVINGAGNLHIGPAYRKGVSTAGQGFSPGSWSSGHRSSPAAPQSPTSTTQGLAGESGPSSSAGSDAGYYASPASSSSGIPTNYSHGSYSPHAPPLVMTTMPFPVMGANGMVNVQQLALNNFGCWVPVPGLTVSYVYDDYRRNLEQYAQPVYATSPPVYPYYGNQWNPAQQGGGAVPGGMSYGGYYQPAPFPCAPPAGCGYSMPVYGVPVAAC
ncbi:uncharacterized protein LOC129597690 [Paramacrobiotus metropolitanus]|uniref:uncharacterized protein LOC129597690 n=1 Tax=Paramacrobiotus metropolitanus TaxID=2943436 RepID=UPI0024460798|nr:uncharacterized protein LOC129597690 [Paramacrobiotus metropolitanus]